MKFIILGLIFSIQLQAACMQPDIQLVGTNEDGKKCEILINLNEKYISFDTGKQMCTYTIEDDTLEEFQDLKKDKIVAKGYSNWFDCKAKIYYNNEGKPYKAKLSSRLTLAMTFYNDECTFDN
jgi:hypothetical protein